MSDYRVCVVSGWRRQHPNQTGTATTIEAEALVYTDPLATVVKTFTAKEHHPRTPYADLEARLRDTARAEAEAWIEVQRG